MSDPFASRWPGQGTGGSLATDFVNTLDWRLRPAPRESLKTYPDLVHWAWSAGVLAGADAEALLSWAKAHPRKAAQALAGTVELREAIAALFAAIRDGAPLPLPALSTLDAATRAGSADRSLKAAGRFAEWARREGDPPPLRPAWAVAEDAARILTSSERDRLCQCGDAECGWFFLDTSRNRTRRWCSMESCGNRNKARSFYRRARRRGKGP